MNLGQTMISALALLLLTVLVLNANRLIVQSGEDMMKAEALDIGITLAQSLLQEIETKRFDVASGYPYNTPSDFTSVWSLGPNSSESSQVPLPDQAPYRSAGLGDLSAWGGSSYTGYNDVDDYNGYRRIASMGGISGFDLRVNVFYVTDSDPENSCGYRTYYKRVEVTVTQPTYIPSTRKMKFYTVIAY